MKITCHIISNSLQYLPRFPFLSVSVITSHKSHVREININGKTQLGEIATGRTSLVRKRHNRSDRRNGDARNGSAGIAGAVAVAGTLVRSTLGTLRTADPDAPAEGTPDTQLAVVAAGGTRRTVALMGTPVVAVVDMEIHTLN